MSTVNIKLKNKDDMYVIIDDMVHRAILGNEYLSSLKLLENLRAHSNGYAIYQRCVTTKQGPVYETIYLHKYIAENWVEKPKLDGKLLVRFLNGNVLDCRIANLEWTTMSLLRRHMPKNRSKTGYRGVTEDKGLFKASIYVNRRSVTLGWFDTAEEAAEAYNAKSIELFGKTASLNETKKKKK